MFSSINGRTTTLDLDSTGRNQNLRRSNRSISRKMNMPKVIAAGKTFEVAAEANLREALLAQDIDLYSAGAKVFNCHGHGICGTCLVQIEGVVSAPTKLETTRMAFPPHSAHKDRRLSCQVKVLDDVRVTRFNGHFGEGEQAIWNPEQKSLEVVTTAP
jgi:ferredoxin